MKDHLLGRQHQQKAKEARLTSNGQQSAYLYARVTTKICEAGIRKAYETFDSFGQLSDFRFSVQEKGRIKPKNGTKIYLKYETKAAAEKALSESQSDQLPHGLSISSVDQSPKKPAALSPKRPTKKKGEKASAPGPSDQIDHTLLLTTLGHMVRTRTEDDVLEWLAGQLLLTPEQHQQRVQLCQDLQASLRSRFRTCLVQAFGSSVSGLGFHGCDLDLYAFIDAQSPGCGLHPDGDDKQKVRAVARMLCRLTHLCENIVRIPHARVPLVKFSAPQLGDVQCDMSFKDPMSCQNSRLIGWLMKADPRVRPVTVAIRYWAKRRNLAGGDHHPMRMSSYCITLLVVTFLQQLDPPVLPTVDWCQAPVEQLLIGPWNAAFNPDAVWRSTNTTPANELLRQFFRFYAGFAAEVEALCPLLGGPLPRAQLIDERVGRRLARPQVWAGFCKLVASGQVKPLEADTAFVVQDPMELNFNVARNYRQLGLNRFRECCREAADMPLARLFDEQALPRMRLAREEAAAAAAAAVAAAAAAAAAADSDGRPAPGATKRPLDMGGDRDRNGEPAARKAKPNGDAAAAESDAKVTTSSGAGRLPSGSAAIAEDDAKVTSSSDSSARPPPSDAAPASTDACQAAVKSTESDGKPATAAGGAFSVTSDPTLLRRVLADFDRPPSRVVSVPLEIVGRRRPRTDAERMRHAAAFARLLDEVFSVVLRFECQVMTFDGLDLTMDVVRGYTCSARLPTWEYRKMVTAQLVGRRRTLQFESEVTERALRMGGHPPPTLLAAFSCYLVREGDQLRLCFYEGETIKAGKNCHPFLASFIPELTKRLDFVALFGEDRPKEE